MPTSILPIERDGVCRALKHFMRETRQRGSNPRRAWGAIVRSTLVLPGLEEPFGPLQDHGHPVRCRNSWLRRG